MENEKYIISEFEKQRNENLKSTKPINDFIILEDIANYLKINTFEVLSIIEKSKNNNVLAKFKNSFPTT